MCMYVYVCVCVCVCLYMYIYIYLFIYIQYLDHVCMYVWMDGWMTWIMVTSFAPSPIERVIGIGSSCRLIIATTCSPVQSSPVQSSPVQSAVAAAAAALR